MSWTPVKQASCAWPLIRLVILAQGMQDALQILQVMQDIAENIAGIAVLQFRIAERIAGIAGIAGRVLQNSLQANIAVIADIAGSIAGIAGFEGVHCRRYCRIYCRHALQGIAGNFATSSSFLRRYCR